MFYGICAGVKQKSKAVRKSERKKSEAHTPKKKKDSDTRDT